MFFEVQVKLLGEHSSPQRLALATAGLFATLSLLEAFKESVAQRHYDALVSLSAIVASHEISDDPGFQSTTLYDFVDNWEEPVGRGGTVRILTRNVDAYDSLPTALRVIGENLDQGAFYTYLLPKGRSEQSRFGAYLRSLQAELTSTQGKSYADARALILRQVRLILVSVPVFTSFGLLSTGSDDDDRESAFWYTAKPERRDDGASVVTFALLGASEREQLALLFDSLERHSTVGDCAKLLDADRGDEE